MKLTNHFSYAEFDPNSMLISSELGRHLITSMAVMCERVRRLAGNNRVDVNSGVRTLVDYERLKKAGYNPSPTSDHFYAQPVIASGTKVHCTSVGASDLNILGLRKKFPAIVEGLFAELGTDDLMKMPMQLIYETDSKGNEWLHIANAPSVLWSVAGVDAVRPNQRTDLGYRIKYTTDGGEHYLPYSRLNVPEYFK